MLRIHSACLRRAWAACHLLEALESRRLLTAEVWQLTLIDAQSDQDLGPLIDGMVIDEAFLPSEEINIRADVNGAVSFVRFDLNEEIGYRVENTAPYAIGRDSGGDYDDWNVDPGTYLVGAVPFFDQDGVPAAGTGLSASFTLLSTQPSRMRAEAIHYSRIDLSWRDNSDYETGFEVQRSVDGGAFAPIALVGQGITDYVDEDVTAGVSYVYRVAAMLEGGGLTIPSGEAAVLIDPGVPATPSDFEASVLSWDRVGIEWDDESGNEQGFVVERSTDAAVFEVVGQVGPLTANFVDTPLLPETAYYYRIAAFNPAGNSAYTPVVTVLTNPRPPIELRPGPHNTGPIDPSLLEPAGSITSSFEGQVIENVDVTGRILIRHNNVTVRNFRVTATGLYGINVFGDLSGILLEYGQVLEASSALIIGNGFTARYLDLAESGSDAIKPGGNVVVEQSWVHNLGTSPGSHADGVQIVGGSNMVFRNNFFDMPVNLAGYRSNAAFIIDNSVNHVSDILIQGNWLNGGNFTMYVLDKSDSEHAHPEGVVIVGNWFGRDYRFGLRSITDTELVKWSDNRWGDTGGLISDAELSRKNERHRRLTDVILRRQ
jgi:hypothetical protein